MTITNKSTKAEILAAYNTLAAAYAADRAQAVAPRLTWEAARNTAEVVWVELQAAVRDTYAAGRFCRKAFDQLVDAYRQPVLQR